MTPEQISLISQLDDFEIGPRDARLDFLSRLARDNAWSRDFAKAVYAEYKRFLVIAMTAGHPVTPSEMVDQVWHLHLCYSKSYWIDLCEGILDRPFHHGPTEGGETEGEKFHDWYSKTLESYEKIFEEEPPELIWPDPVKRFKDADRFARVNTAENAVLPFSRSVLYRCIFGSLFVGSTVVVLAKPDALISVLAVFALMLFVIAMTGFIMHDADRTRFQHKVRGSRGCGGCGAFFVGSGVAAGTSGTGGCGGSGCGDAGCGDAGCGGGGCGGGGCGGCGGCGG